MADDFVTLPRRPTPEMLAVFTSIWSGGDWIASAMSLTKRQLKRAEKAWTGMLKVAPPAPRSDDAQREEMSPDFTDSARAAIAWVLYHHQGGKSAIGQPLRFALGMGAHEPLQEWRIAEAKRWAACTGSTTADFHAPCEAAQEPMSWSTSKPTVPGAYWVRGYCVGSREDKALVEVRFVADKLCCNLHCINSDNDDELSPLETYSRKFEWLGPLHPAPQQREGAPLRPVTEDDVDAAVAAYIRVSGEQGSAGGFLAALESFRSRLAGEGA